LQLLSKSKIISGIQCHKKLWLETHGKQDTLESHLFALGNRFGEFARIHYGEGVNLDGKKLSDNVVELTNAAISNPNINTIYEAAFVYENVLVRVDVLKRDNDGWVMIEVKSSKEAKPHHLNDIASQAYVAKGYGLKLNSMKIAHINKDFIYTGDGNYSGLLVEADVTIEAIERLSDVKTWVSDLLPIVQLDSPRPIEDIEDFKCKTPYPCQFLPLCSAELPQLAEVPISILPNIGKKLAEKWGEEKIYDLRDLPDGSLTNERHEIIRKVHQTNSPYISKEMVKKVRSLPGPYFFMDFETVMQGVPLIPNTKPNDAIPFQWSVHSLNDLSDTTGINDGKGFLDFSSPTLSRDFLTSLISALGEFGTIFVHHKSTEIKALRYLAAKKECEDLKEPLEKIILRIEDTLDLVRDGMYFPKMGLSGGSTYSIKTITKVIPTSVDYLEDGELGSGNDAQLIWFKCTDSKKMPSASELQAFKNSLLKYCAKDTLALVDLVRFIHTQSIH
jgi:predicted RecB family nuclease